MTRHVPDWPGLDNDGPIQEIVFLPKITTCDLAKKMADERMPVYWVDKAHCARRDNAKKHGVDEETKVQSKRQKPSEETNYVFFEISKDPLNPTDIDLMGIVGRTDAEHWWHDEPLYFNILGWDSANLPVLEFRGERNTCSRFENGVYYLDHVMKCGKYVEFNKIQCLEIRDDSEDGADEWCITVVPHKYPGINSGVYEARFFTWCIEDASKKQWPQELQFIKESAQNGFVMAPHTLTAAKLCNILTAFCNPPMNPMHPRDAIIGKHIYAHCEEGPNATLLPMAKPKD